MIDDIIRLEEIQQEMLELLDEAKILVQQTGDRTAFTRAKSYWLGHITTALTRNHDYLGSSMCCLEDTINELRNNMEPGEE